MNETDNAQDECAAPYMIETSSEDQRIIATAIGILERRLRVGVTLNSSSSVKDYLRLQNSKHRDREAFGALFLTAQNSLIKYEELFIGTLTQTSVYPREVVKHALLCGAAAVIFTHNHPSGCAEPSRADELLTQTLKSALNLIDVRVLDHIVTSDLGATSMSERGLI